MTLPPLTPKRQRFVQEYLIDSNGTQAAIRAGFSEKTARSAASELLAKPNVAAAVAAGRVALAEQHGITLKGHLDTLASLRDGAKNAYQYAAAITAETNRGKVGGFYVDRTELSGNPDRPVVVQEWVFGGKKVTF